MVNKRGQCVEPLKTGKKKVMRGEAILDMRKYKFERLVTKDFCGRTCELGTE